MQRLINSYLYNYMIDLCFIEHIKIAKYINIFNTTAIMHAYPD